MGIQASVKPNYFFIHKDFDVQKDYENGFSVSELFNVNNVGIVTSRDNFVIDNNKNDLGTKINDFFTLDKKTLQNKYSLKENKSWKIEETKNKAKNFDTSLIKSISYRPFDDKFIYFSNNFIERSRMKVMQHFLKETNLGLVVGRQSTEEKWSNVQVSQYMIDNRFHFSYKGISSLFPLYLYHDKKSDNLLSEQSRVPNLNNEIINTISTKLNLQFVDEKEKSKSNIAPIDILDYIYAVLHSPTYREKYKEFLKIDFPRIPYPKYKNSFWELVNLGKELRQLHLLESPKVENYMTSYPIDGDNKVIRKIVQKDSEITDDEKQIGRVWINDNQYFEGIPEVAWEFYVGGYQPAQRWLKDRKGRELSVEDIFHYHKIIVALSETDELMKEIDKIEIE